MFVPTAPIICLTLVRQTECSSHQYSTSCAVWALAASHQTVSSILPEKLFWATKNTDKDLCMCSRPADYTNTAEVPQPLFSFNQSLRDTIVTKSMQEMSLIFVHFLMSCLKYEYSWREWHDITLTLLSLECLNVQNLLIYQFCVNVLECVSPGYVYFSWNIFWCECQMTLNDFWRKMRNFLEFVIFLQNYTVNIYRYKAIGANATSSVILYDGKCISPCLEIL